MERRKFLFRSVQTSALILVSGTMLGKVLPTLKQKKKVHFHYLLFWLKKDLTSAQIKEFENFFIGLSKLPYQKNLRFGFADNSSPRAVLDNSFTYNCSMEFDSLEDLETYGKLPAHIALVEKYKPFFEKMMVHDSVYN